MTKRRGGLVHAMGRLASSGGLAAWRFVLPNRGSGLEVSQSCQVSFSCLWYAIAL